MIQLVQSHTNATLKWDSTRFVNVHSALQTLLHSLKCIHVFWRQPNPLTNDQFNAYHTNVNKFAQCWGAFKWKGTVWVHWVIAHSSYLMQQFKTIFMFSSIPTEHKHKRFKLDMRNSVRICGSRKRRLNKGGLVHVVELDALDLGIALHQGKPPKRRCL